MREEESWPRRYGHFELLSLLGQGGMAEVYRARFALGPQKGQLVALKRVRRERLRDAEVLAQVRQEALVSRLMSHPHVVRLIEAGELTDGSYYLALELVEGTDLGQLLAECRRRRIQLPIDISVYIIRQLLEALAHAHLATNEAGLPLALVHCDVSPSNVLLSHEGEVKLSDFGVARARGGARVDVRRLGKGHYRSPELLEGKVSDAVDLWATAVMLYELLTLESPFPGSTTEQVEQSIRAGQRVPVRTREPRVPEKLAQVLERALALNPLQRFSTAAQFARVLAPLYDERVATPLAVAAVVRGLLAAPSARRMG